MYEDTGIDKVERVHDEHTDIDKFERVYEMYEHTGIDKFDRVHEMYEHTCIDKFERVYIYKTIFDRINTNATRSKIRNTIRRNINVFHVTMTSSCLILTRMILIIHRA